MNPIDRLQRLFDYDAWACQKITNILEEYPTLTNRDKILKLFGHLLNAQQIWYRRAIGEDFDDLELWPKLSLEECKTIHSSIPDKWTKLLEANREEPDTLITYKNTRGESFETMLSDILHHLIIHGQHHRAQIATLIRESGLTPPTTDFIYYTRSIA